MPKLTSAIAASALLIALSAPGFAADLDSSSSHRGSSATIQNRDDLKAGTSTKSGANAQLNDKDSVNGSTSIGNKSSMDRDREMDRDQSAQLPKADRDASSPGRSGTSPGHEMQEHGSVPGSPGASGYAPGHTK
jgi:hypothetical protein